MSKNKLYKSGRYEPPIRICGKAHSHCVICDPERAAKISASKNKQRVFSNWCYVCQLESNDVSLFVKSSRAHICLKCSAEKQRTNIKDRVEILAKLKDKPCLDCGGSFPSECMDFDHIQGEKLFDISKAVSLGRNMTSIIEETKKCEIVCSNCHRIRTKQRRNS